MAQYTVTGMSIEDLATLEKLFIRQQLYLWQLTEMECEIQIYISELKTKISNKNIDNGAQLNSNHLSDDKNRMQTRILNFINSTETGVALQNVKINEFIDSQLEFCNQIEDMKIFIKTFHENSTVNNTDYCHKYEEIDSNEASEIQDIIGDAAEAQLNNVNIKNEDEFVAYDSGSNMAEESVVNGSSKVVKRKGATLCCTICRKIFKNRRERKIHLDACYPDLQCPICNRKSINRRKFGEHLRKCQTKESASGNIICSMCNKGFADIYLRAVHLRKVHKISKKYPCDQCDRTFTDLRGLRCHIHQHTGDKPFICDYCNEKFRHRESIVRHMMKHSSYKYLCSICGIGKETATTLATHMQSHSGEKNFKCPECDERFAYKALMVKHVKRIHQGIVDKFQCSQCDNFFAAKGGLKLHLLRKHGPHEKTYKCSKCDRSFYTNTLLKKHNKTKHEHRELLECSECNKMFKSKDGLQAHLLTHTSERNVECNECSSKFYTVHKLKAHIRNTHNNLDVKYTCEICNAVSKSMASYIQHKHTHTKPYECHICEKSFGQIGTLNSHLLTHSGEKPHICDFCNKGFTQPSDLKTHRRIHTGEKPFSCPHCDRKFTDNRNMKKHLKVHDAK